MENPYQAPDSKLVIKEDLTSYQPSFIWKIYFWFSVVGAILIVAFYAVLNSGILNSDDEFKFGIDFNWFDLFDFTFWLLLLLAIYGLAWSKKTVNRTFWRIYFYLFIVWSIIFTVMFPLVFKIPNYGEISTVKELLSEIPFKLIDCYLLYRYSYSMNFLWGENKTSGETQ